MGEVTTIGLDLAKSIFQAHGADAAGASSGMVTNRLWDRESDHRNCAANNLFCLFEGLCVAID
jgi:4-hydroxybenzoate polyprenyltransferase